MFVRLVAPKEMADGFGNHIEPNKAVILIGSKERAHVPTDLHFPRLRGRRSQRKKDYRTLTKIESARDLSGRR